MSKRRHRLLGPLRQAPGLTAGLACGVALIAVSACSSGRSGLFDNTPYAGDIEPTIGRPQVAQPPPPVEPVPAPEPTVEAAELPPPDVAEPAADVPQPAEAAVPPRAPITAEALDDAGAPQPAPRITTAPPTVTTPPVTTPPAAAPPAAAPTAPQPTTPTPTAPPPVVETPVPAPPAAAPPAPVVPRAQVATAPPQLILAPPTIPDAPRPTTVAEAPTPSVDPVSPPLRPATAAPVTPEPVTSAPAAPAPVSPAPSAPTPAAEVPAAPPAGTPAIDRLPRPPTREGFPSLSDVPPRPTDLPTQAELAEMQERLERDRAALQAGEVPQRLTPRIPDQPAPAFSGLEGSSARPSAPTPDRGPTVGAPVTAPTGPVPADARPRTEAPALPSRPAQAAALPTPPAPAIQAVSLPPLALRIPPPPQPIQVAADPVLERQAAPEPAIRPAPVASPTPPSPTRSPSATPPTAAPATPTPVAPTPVAPAPAAPTPVAPAPSAPDTPQVAAVAPPQPPAPPPPTPSATTPAVPLAPTQETDQPPVIPGPVETQPLTDFRVDEPEGIPDSQLPADPTERAFLLAFSQSGRTILPDGQVSGTARLPTLAVLPAAARPAAPSGQFAPTVQPLTRPAAPPAQLPVAALPPVSQPAVLVQPVTAQPVAFPVSPLSRGNLAATIFFAEGSARLSERDREVIAAIVEEHRRTGARIHVLGHASRTGGIADPILRGVTNYGESLNRAQAVSAYLSQLGVPATMMSVDAAGEQLAGSDEIRNRRAEIYLDYAVWQG